MRGILTAGAHSSLACSCRNVFHCRTYLCHVHMQRKWEEKVQEICPTATTAAQLRSIDAIMRVAIEPSQVSPRVRRTSLRLSTPQT